MSPLPAVEILRRARGKVMLGGHPPDPLGSILEFVGTTTFACFERAVKVIAPGVPAREWAATATRRQCLIALDAAIEFVKEEE